MKASRTLALCALGLLSPFSAAADQQAQAGDGLRLAREWCSACHVVEAGRQGSDAAPPFGVIANDPKKTRSSITAWLYAPHPPMPQMNLSRPDIAAINDYIESLKRK